MKANTTIYILSALLLISCFIVIDEKMNLFNLISYGGIFATFGSALLATTVIFEQKSEQRVRDNIGIFYNEIIKVKQWRRWEFLERRKTKKLLDKKNNSMILSNPEIPFDVGSHTITINLPTVAKDFFDLPVFSDYYKLRRFDKAFHTTAFRKISDGKDNVVEEEKGNDIMSYQCVKDILKHACIYRSASLIKHFSIGMIIFSIFMVILFIIFPAMNY